MMCPFRDPLPVLFVTSNLCGGGAERALVTLINHLDRERFQPHLALFQKEGIFLNDLSRDIEVCAIQPQHSNLLWRNWTRVSGLRRLYHRVRPSVIMSALWQANAVTVLAALLWRFRAPVIIAEHTAPQASMSADPRRRLLWPFARQLYRRASHIVAVSEGIAKELRDDGCAREDQVSVIHNPIPCPQESHAEGGRIRLGPEEVPVILAVGRLVPLKNHALLLQAAALVLQHMDVSVFIVGEGPERHALESLVAALDIGDHVHLIGFQHNLNPFFSAADLLVHTSVFEGFSNVLIEAMTFGVPIISTDCPYGPREILDNGRFGVLVPPGDVHSLADAILELAGDEDERKRLSTVSRERAADFAPAQVIPQYEKLFAVLAMTRGGDV